MHTARLRKVTVGYSRRKVLEGSCRVRNPDIWTGFALDDVVDTMDHFFGRLGIGDNSREEISEGLFRSLCSLELLMCLFFADRSSFPFHYLLRTVRLHKDSDRIDVRQRLQTADRITRNVEDTMSSLASDVFHTLDACSIEIILELSCLYEHVVLNFFLHSLFVHEVIISSMDLIRSGRTRSVRNTAGESVRETLDQIVIDLVFHGSKNNDWTHVVHWLKVDDLVGEDRLIRDAKFLIGELVEFLS